MSADRSPCPMANLVEARRDGRLGPREVASLDRHMASCPTCAELAEDLELISNLARRSMAAPSPLAHQRRRVRLLREAAIPGAPRRTWRTPTALGVAIAATLVALLVVLRGGPAVSVGARPHTPGPVPSLQRFPAVAWLPLSEASASSEQSAPAHAAPRTETTVRGSEGALFGRSAERGVETVRLESGSVELSVKPLGPGERFLVVTSDAEVEVRGTVFRVDAKASRIRAVVVTEGVVVVTHAGRTYELRAGDSWKPPVSARREEPRPEASAPPPMTAPDLAPTVSPGPEEHARPAQPRDDASKDFSEGVALVERGDYAAAVQRLESFRARHPDDPRAEDAAFLRIVAFQRAGRPGAAAAAARSYLADFPHGTRRAAAESIVAGR